MPIDASIISQARNIPQIRYQPESQFESFAKIQPTLNAMRQLETSRFEMEEKKRQRDALAQMRQQNLDPEGVAQWFMSNGTPEQMQFAMKMLEAAREEKMFRQAFGGQQAAAGGAIPQVAAPQNAMIPAPTAMPAQPAAPQPAVQMVGGKTREELTGLLAHPQKNVRDAAQQMLQQFPKPGRDFAPTEIERLQDAIAQLPAGDARRGPLEARIQMLTTRPEPAQTTIKLPPQQGAFESALGGAQAKKLMDDKAAAEDAVSIIDTVNTGRQLLKSGMITGFGAEFLTNVGSALNQAGINFAEDQVANTQAFSANMAANVGRIIKQFGAGTGLSNADREYAEKMAGGKITLDRKAIERILDINERAARNVIKYHNRRAQGVESNIPLTVEMPPEQQQSQAPMYARNPKTGERIMSVDGGNTWTPAR